jgi:hypothetical protein
MPQALLSRRRSRDRITNANTALTTAVVSRPIPAATPMAAVSHTLAAERHGDDQAHDHAGDVVGVAEVREFLLYREPALLPPHALLLSKST